MTNWKWMALFWCLIRLFLYLCIVCVCSSKLSIKSECNSSKVQYARRSIWSLAMCTCVFYFWIYIVWMWLYMIFFVFYYDRVDFIVKFWLLCALCRIVCCLRLDDGWKINFNIVCILCTYCGYTFLRMLNDLKFKFIFNIIFCRDDFIAFF